MINNEISDDVKNFVLKYIDSVEILEILLLLRKYQSRYWNPSEVSAELRTDILSAERKLLDLKSKSLIQSAKNNPVGYQYVPYPHELEKVVKDVAETYKERRFSVIDLIFSKPIEKIQTFADAFKFIKDKKNG